MPLVGLTSLWHFDQSGNDLGTSWSTVGYNDSAWPTGRGLLAVEDCGCLPEAINTPLSLVNGPVTVITYYFRTTFIAPTNGNVSGLQIYHVLDDGAIFYLNGQEILRVNMPTDTVTFSTQASTALGNASLQGPVVLPAALLQTGTNLLAVEVHQSGATSSDIVFGMSLDALIVTNTAAAGSVVLNEVLAANSSVSELNGTTPDWIELYNQSAGQVDLSGLSVSDDTLQPRRWVIPEGTLVAPNNWVRILCDGTQPASTNNTGFGLKSNGGSVYLFDAAANGGSLLSSLTYGLQVSDLSVGRVPDGSTNWVLCGPTPAAANQTVASLGNPAVLKINEWMAAPGSGLADWFEVYNPDSQPVALGGLYLTDDLNDRTKCKIPPLSFIGAGSNAWQTFTADSSTGAGADHVNFALSRGGEALGIFASNGTLIDAAVFWAQQDGVSEGRFPNGATNNVAFPGTDSPGASNWRLLTNIVINEVLTHTDPPLEDAIEVQNVSDQPIDIGGWWLSDDEGTLQKYQIPSGTVLPAGGFVVVYENVFTNRDTAAVPFALSSRGDQVVLSAFANNAFTGWRTHVKFGAIDNGVSFGRYVTSDRRAEFVAQSRRTLGVEDPGSVEEFRTGTGRTNAYPAIGPVVVTEIMYHPPDVGTLDNVTDEFIELHNITTTDVPLFDIAHPTNTWHLRDAVDFNFPPGIVLQAGGYLLVVSFDPVNNPATLAAFQSKYGLGTNVMVVGPYQGKLANDSDDIELRRPAEPDVTGVDYILVERVRYSDVAPWPVGADGTGSSLQRLRDTEFANDPINWTAAAPGAGRGSGNNDSDGDSMPDDWEMLHGFDRFSALDAGLDADGDGLSNLQEYLLGTDPRNRSSGLELKITLLPDRANLVLSFTAVSNYSYAIEWATGISGTTWATLQEIESAPTNRLIEVTVPAASPGRFYRLRSPGNSAATNLISFEPIQLNGNELILHFTVPANQALGLEFNPTVGPSGWTTLTNYWPVTTNRGVQFPMPMDRQSGFYRLRSP